MAQVELAGQRLEVDDHGFLQELEKWNEDIAKAFAAAEGVNELTEEHWKVIHYLRNYYLEFKICPMVKKLTKQTGVRLKSLWELFPQGPANSACKWAGVPKPTGCH
jgi:TusE/DsrC/DsvC family sulfur relay protein